MNQDNPNYPQQPYQNQGQGQQQQQQYQQNQGNYQFPHQGNKLPADPAAMTLGIVSLVLFFITCWCYGLPAFITLTLSIIGLVMSNKSVKLYRENPSNYSASSEKNVSTARIINIIGLALSGLACLIVLGFILVFGAAFASEFDKKLNTNGYGDDTIYSDDYDYDSDTDTEDTWQYEEEELDTTSTSTESVLEVEEIIED